MSNLDYEITFEPAIIDYQAYKRICAKHCKTSCKQAGRKLNLLDLFLSAVSGFVLQTVVYLIMGVNMEEVPPRLILILWVLFSSLSVLFIRKLDDMI